LNATEILFYGCAVFLAKDTAGGVCSTQATKQPHDYMSRYVTFLVELNHACKQYAQVFELQSAGIEFLRFKIQD